MDTRTITVHLDYETGAATFSTDSVLDLALIYTQADKAIRGLTGMDTSVFFEQAREMFAPITEGSSA